MNEIDLYEISDWGANLECYISLSYNSHPMASNILYANFNTLTANFSLCFHLTERTVFLYEKLLGKYKTVFNSHTERKYILLSKKYQIDYKNQILTYYEGTINHDDELYLIHYDLKKLIELNEIEFAKKIISNVKCDIKDEYENERKLKLLNLINQKETEY